MRRKAVALLVALALTAAAARAADAAADERVLKQAGVASDDAGLLHFFGRNSPTEDDVRSLIAKLGDDDFAVREKATKGLIALGPAAAPALREASKSADPEVARRAEECLKHVGAGPSPAVVAAAARLVAKRKPAGAAAVLLAYAARAAGDGGADDVRAALAAVALRDGKADPDLLKALDDKAPGRRAEAAAALARAGAGDALPAVRKLLHDADPAVRLPVALALAALKEKDAVPVLIALLAELSRAQAAPAEDLLYRLADDDAPDAVPGTDDAARKKYRDAWAGWWKKNGNKADLAKLAGAGKFLGYTMLVQLDAGRVVEYDADKKVRWQVGDLEFPLDAQRLPGDRVLVAEYKGGRVTERNRKGAVLWEKRLDGPLAAQRLPDGNTFIATRYQLLEVDGRGKAVFTYSPPGGGDLIMKAQKLPNGDVGMVVAAAGRAAGTFVRLDRTGKELARFPVDVSTSGGRIEVLPNGHVVAPLKDQNKVVEYDAAGKAVWQADFPEPVAAVRLPNGHTLVTSFQAKRAAELGADGKVVWEFKADARVTRAWRR